MKFPSKYLLNLSRKTIRFSQFLKYYVYSIFRKEIAEYPNPPDSLKEIGCFDRKMLVRTSEEYKRYFDPVNLSDISQHTLPYKENKITLILDGGEILIKKYFSGSRKFNDFYSELICYNKIGHLDITPEIQYVDYEKTTIYMKYIDGVCLAGRRKGIKEIAKNNNNIIRDSFQSITKLLHNHGIIFYDMGGRNFVMKGNRVYIFDFSDAMYFGECLLSLMPVKKVFQKLVELERRKVSRSLNNLGISEK